MKKALLIGLPLLLLVAGGGAVGLAALGVVRVPFLFAKKKGPPPPADDGKGGPFASTFALVRDLGKQAATVAPKVAAVPSPPPPDPGPGEEKLAGLWAEMPTDRLVSLLGKWPEPQLGRILAAMDEEAVTNLLAALPPSRAASLSRSIAAATNEKAANSSKTAGK